ncbi:MAG TPA: nitrogen fixation protein NifH [Dehalococcoidia bacterium]|nr:nitrogen fixation protein NifH [Dehalococcoidia bacterium]
MAERQDWKKVLKADPTDWLLEPDDPGVRYLALRDIVEAGTAELGIAKKTAHISGPIAEVLSKMDKEGFWVKPGAGYSPMYTGTAWSVILLAQLGATIDMDKRIATACEYVLDHNLTKYGHFTTRGSPSSTLECLQGNLCCSLLELGCTDPRLDKSYELMARIVTGEGIAPMTDRKVPLRYYAGDLCGPGFACGGTLRKPCAWGAIKIMLAFGKLPAEKKTPMIERAIKMGVDFLFSKDPATADYPVGYSPKPTGKPSGNWWKFGFPTFMVSDILQNAEALARLGYGQDPRLANALQLILDKQDGNGRWPMEYSYTGKTWGDFGPKKQPNKWVTLRALRVLKQVTGRR